MAGKLDLRKFYEDTKITEEHVHLLNLRTRSLPIQDRDYKIATANMSFGMLAHLNVTSNPDTIHLELRLIKSGITNFDDRTGFLESLSKLSVCDNFKLNPTAITMIQRYRSAFDKYEAQLGIQNPFTKKSGKEPGDN